jgi:hypothetical protein
MNDNTIGPDGLRDDERRACGCRDLGCARFHLGTHVFRARLIESRAETEAEKRAHAETRAQRDAARNEIGAAWAGRDNAAELERDACVRQVRAEDERDKAQGWMHRLADRLDEVLSATRWDNHDNWCPAATDAFLPYRQSKPPECNCVIRDGWRDVEGARASLAARSTKKDG